MGVNQGITITELAGNIYFYWDPGKFFQIILADDAGMVSRTTGYDIHLMDIRKFFLGPVQLVESNFPFLFADTAAHGIADSLGLLVNLFEHEMLETAFFSSFGIPGYFVNFLGDGHAVNVLHPDAVLGDGGNLAVAHDISTAGMGNDRRNIGSDKVFPFA